MRGNLSCDINAQCNNTVGSFDCICSDGFTGNGTHCDGKQERNFVHVIRNTIKGH